ncbi:pyrimidine 5'-nucleotidase [Amaricoccus tamworthensis]|uniref:pyrimidine 5'-nucleotidase n=1 Tax=Amaricoccus tamworthensis TaxID=57002 RepID=UPI003C7B809C
MPKEKFQNVTTWVFDLDHTLYPPDANLFHGIQEKMTGYVMRELKLEYQEAAELRSRYWREHGTTLAGLMLNHGIDPHPFLDEVHDIALDALSPDLDLVDSLHNLPGRRIVFTNGSKEHARRVTRARGIDGAFDAFYGIECAGFTPKPHRTAFDRVIELDGFEPGTAAMFEDEARNLEIPYELGMQTVLVGQKSDQAYIHHQTDDLTGFLRNLA